MNTAKRSAPETGPILQCPLCGHTGPTILRMYDYIAAGIDQQRRGASCSRRECGKMIKWIALKRRR